MSKQPCSTSSAIFRFFFPKVMKGLEENRVPLETNVGESNGDLMFISQWQELKKTM